jgi:hypothetical protein
MSTTTSRIPLPAKPFETAERYIQLKKKYAPTSWYATMSLISDMILMPIITIFFIFLYQADPMTVGMTVLKSYQVWKEYTEFVSLKFEVQNMFLYCQAVGGPFIVTNNPTYMPYVFADATYRVPVGMAKLPPTGTLDG